MVFSELKRKGFVFLLLTFEIPIKFKTHVHMRLTATKEHTGISLQKKILHWFREEKKNMVVYFRGPSLSCRWLDTNVAQKQGTRYWLLKASNCFCLSVATSFGSLKTACVQFQCTKSSLWCILETCSIPKSQVISSLRCQTSVFSNERIKY